MTCEYCNRAATHVDHAAIDLTKQGPNQSEPGYRDRYLCLNHAIEASRQNTSRLEKLGDEEEEEDEDGD